MAYFLQQLVNGIALGSIYGLIAIGYTMVYGVLRFINFAHGDIFMLGAFAGYYFAPLVNRFLPAQSYFSGALVLVLAMAVCAVIGMLIAIPAVAGFIWSGYGVPDRPPLSLGFVSLPAVLLIFPMTMTMAPLVVKGRVLVGNSGGEFGVRGWPIRGRGTTRCGPATTSSPMASSRDVRTAGRRGGSTS